MLGIYIYEKPQVLTSGNMVYELDGNICVLNVDGTSLQTLTDNGTATDPSFSPDGTKILYVTFPLDGLTVPYSENESPEVMYYVPACLSSEGYKIIYVKNDNEIYMMDNDGMLKEKLADGHSPPVRTL